MVVPDTRKSATRAKTSATPNPVTAPLVDDPSAAEVAPTAPRTVETVDLVPATRPALEVEPDPAPTPTVVEPTPEPAPPAAEPKRLPRLKLKLSTASTRNALRQGYPSWSVAMLQSVLAQHGYSTAEVDGRGGPRLLDALNRFRHDAALPWSDDVDPETLAALGFELGD